MPERSLEQTALEKWYATEQYRKLAAGPADGEILLRRLWEAFIAGMNAGKQIGKAEAVEAFRKMIGG